MAEGVTPHLLAGDCCGKPDPSKTIWRGRKWIQRGGRRECGEAPSFTVASYNVLSQNLLVRHLELYEKCNRDHLQWNFRKSKLLEEIDRYSPDVLCLQEVHKDEFKPFFQQNLNKRGYNGIYKERPGRGNEDGCATFYKTEMFTLVETKLIDYGMYDSYCAGKNNVAILVALKFNCKEQDSIVCVANTHILYNPNRGDVKLTQLMILLAEIDHFCCRYPHYLGDEFIRCPGILCGDLNVVPQSRLYLFLCSGQLTTEDSKISELCGLPSKNDSRFYPSDDRHLLQCNFIPYQITPDCRFKLPGYNYSNMGHVSHIKHHLNLLSAYPHIDMPVVTSYHSGSAINLDYILYSAERSAHDKRHRSDDVSEKGLHLVEWLEVPSASDNTGPLPNDWNGSDHIMIMSRFLFY